MDHYVDIRLRPDPEFPVHQLMDALFAKLHRLLAQLGSNDIGVSFPEAGNAKVGLGRRLRLHGTQHSLQRAMDTPWLSGMRDHAEISSVSPVPTDAKHCCVRRVQAKSSPERLRRRQMKRKGWTEERARAAIPDSATEQLNLPYLTVRSTSTGQAFRLFVRQEPVNSPTAGSFNAYGFSGAASIAWF
jgi:CRISPR-associated endonuclease Csy4